MTSNAAAAKFADAAAAPDEVSVEGWFTPSTLPQTGPVRLVTIFEGRDSGEATADRPFTGSLHEVTLYTEAPTKGEVIDRFYSGSSR